MQLNKIIETDPYLVSKTGTVERTVRIIGEGEDLRHEKLASEAVHFARSVRSKPGSTYILVLAMGASEYYGPNRNGDAFRESELLKHYKTFESNAHVFKSHVNKDPAKSIGSVTQAFYNRDMHRVELILELIDRKCQDIISKIRANQDVAVSMGCRIKYDVCSICGNKAPTRADYCKHLKYELNEIYPDGRIVAADNPSPTFFDISVVWRPADKTGYMLKKVANFGVREKGASSAELAAKTAAKTQISKYLRKAADIDKIVTGVGINPDTVKDEDDMLAVKWLQTIAPRMVSSYNRISDQDIKDLSKHDFSAVLKGLSSRNIFLMTPEFLDLLFQKVIGSMAPEGLSSKMVDLQSSIFDLLSRNPETSSSVVEEKVIDPEAEVSQDLEKKLSSISRSVPYSRTYERPSLSSITGSLEGVKLAGLSSTLYSVYSAINLESCYPRGMTKIAHLSNVDSFDSAVANNKLGYLLNRAADIYSNPTSHYRQGFSKISSRLLHTNDLSLDEAGSKSDLEIGLAILNS